MKYLKFLLIIIIASRPFFAFAQEGVNLSNIDSLFDSPQAVEENAEEDNGADEGPGLLEQVILSRGFSLEASYSLLGLIAPGWSEPPWIDNSELPEGEERVFNVKTGMHMSADLNLDIQLSDALRVQQSISFQILDIGIKIKEFFLDYNFGQKAFVRAGQFNLNWGQSHNFQFTNLLARIPLNYVSNNPGNALSPKYLRINVPIGIGGFEGIISARFINDFEKLSVNDLGYGIKYNFV